MKTLSRRGAAWRPILLILLGLNLAVMGFWWWTLQRSNVRLVVTPAPSQDLPVISQTADFEMTRQDGQVMSLSSLAGHPWIGTFLFTRCPYQCPMLSVKLAMLQKEMPAKARIVSFSVDPRYDTPEVLKAYGEKFAANFETWYFLTGEASAVAAIQRSWKLAADEEPSMHTLRFVLVDGRGMVRGYYNSEDPEELRRLRRDLGVIE